MDVFGTSGHAKVIFDTLSSNGIQNISFWDDDDSKQIFVGLKVLGKFEDFKNRDSNKYIVAIGNNLTRKNLVKRLRETTSFAIHNASVISSSAKIGVGTVVMANATINADTVVGNHVIVNTNASIDHDCIIADFVHVSPNAALAGGVTVGEGSHIGIGACVIQGITIGSWCVIGAGTVVIENVPDGCTLVGNPGRIIKRHE